MPRIASITLDLANVRLCVRFEYDAGLIRDIKHRIDKSLRAWDPESRCWFVDPGVRDILKVCFTHHEFSVREQTFGAPAHAPSNGHSRTPAEEMVRLAGPQALKALYRALSLEHHPDKGGSTETMKQVNLLWERVRGNP